ncbi:hypothetical protein MRX96_004347 [Rhipicephalus microplus]
MTFTEKETEATLEFLAQARATQTTTGNSTLLKPSPPSSGQQPILQREQPPPSLRQNHRIPLNSPAQRSARARRQLQPELLQTLPLALRHLLLLLSTPCAN